jgi:hypothetical protein
VQIAEHAKRHLPRPILAVLRPIYNVWARWALLDKESVHNIMEYFGLSHNEAVCMLRLGCKLNASYWNIVRPKTADEIGRFYEVTPFYVFDLAYWHMQKGTRRFREEVLAVASGDTLDYGGGVGDLSVDLAAKGLNVTYADVSGVTLDFARWLFKKKRHDVRIIDLAHQEV